MTVPSGGPPDEIRYASASGSSSQKLSAKNVRNSAIAISPIRLGISECAANVSRTCFSRSCQHFDKAIDGKTPQIDPLGIGDVSGEGGKDRIAKLLCIIQRQGVKSCLHRGKPSPRSPA